jgi:adenine phosphoribosyltransferase
VTLDLRDKIRDVPDFPTEGILFKDVMPLIADPEYFAESIRQLASGQDLVSRTSSSEPRRAGSSSAERSRTSSVPGFIAARKPGKLPWETVEATYDLEYGTDSQRIHRDAVRPGARVVILDDVLATGGTAKAKCELVEQLGGIVVGAVFLIELTFLNGRDRLTDYEIHSLIKY